jgi:hypothetical protein
VDSDLFFDSYPFPQKIIFSILNNDSDETVEIAVFELKQVERLTVLRFIHFN